MGHAYVRNLDEILIKSIYAKGKISINELLNIAKKRKEPLLASEGPYEDWEPGGMVEYGFLQCILWHMKNWKGKDEEPSKLIEPIIETDEDKKTINIWLSGSYNDFLGDDFIDFCDKLNSIKWKFTKGGRKCYIDKRVNFLCDLEN